MSTEQPQDLKPFGGNLFARAHNYNPEPLIRSLRILADALEKSDDPRSYVVSGGLILYVRHGNLIIESNLVLRLPEAVLQDMTGSTP